MSDTIELTADLNSEGLEVLIARWIQKKNKALIDALTTMGRTTCRAMMEFTYPRDDHKMPQRVEAQILKVYGTTSQVYEDIKAKSESAADAFWYFVSARKWATAKKIMQVESPSYGDKSLSPFDGGAVHKRARGERGNVKAYSPFYIVAQKGKKDLLGQYIEKKKFNVGMAKAGWYHCWRILGRAEGAPDFVARHRGKEFGSVEKREGPNPKVTITNNVRHASDAISDRYKDWIYGAAAGRFREFLQRQLGDIK